MSETALEAGGSRRKDKSRLRVAFEWILGITFLLIGLAGFVLPILQGWIFVLAGLAVLGNHSRRIHRLNLALRSWLKRFGRRFRRRSGHRLPECKDEVAQEG